MKYKFNSIYKMRVQKDFFYSIQFVKCRQIKSNSVNEIIYNFDVKIMIRVRYLQYSVSIISPE